MNHFSDVRYLIINPHHFITWIAAMLFSAMATADIHLDMTIEHDLPSDVTLQLIGLFNGQGTLLTNQKGEPITFTQRPQVTQDQSVVFTFEVPDSYQGQLIFLQGELKDGQGRSQRVPFPVWLQGNNSAASFKLSEICAQLASGQEYFKSLFLELNSPRMVQWGGRIPDWVGHIFQKNGEVIRFKEQLYAENAVREALLKQMMNVLKSAQPTSVDLERVGDLLSSKNVPSAVAELLTVCREHISHYLVRKGQIELDVQASQQRIQAAKSDLEYAQNQNKLSLRMFDLKGPLLQSSLHQSNAWSEEHLEKNETIRFAIYR